MLRRLPVLGCPDHARPRRAAGGEPRRHRHRAGHGRRPSGSRPYRATIKRTAHGIPHITAEDFGALGFGSGYATAETSICTLADTVLTGARPAVALVRPERSATTTRSRSRRPTSRSTRSSPTCTTAGSSRSCSPTRRTGRARRRARWSRATSPASTPTCDEVGPERGHRPGVRGRGLPQAERHRPRPLVRRLPRQPARLHRRASSSRSSTPTRRPRTTRASRAADRRVGRPPTSC